MTVNPKQLTQDFLPGLVDQHLVGASGVGIQSIDVTMSAATYQTNAQLVAAPPNTGAGGVSYGPVVHSLGIAPSLAFAQLMGDVGANQHAVSFAYVTADNSAVYLRARTWSAAVIASVRVIVIR